jgi:hypothetical protein
LFVEFTALVRRCMRQRSPHALVWFLHRTLHWTALTWGFSATEASPGNTMRPVSST